MNNSYLTANLSVVASSLNRTIVVSFQRGVTVNECRGNTCLEICYLCPVYNTSFTTLRPATWSAPCCVGQTSCNRCRRCKSFYPHDT
eukprot:6491256-Amphidinium_carterae.2